MRLVTFETKNIETWGFVMENPADQQFWVFEPEKVEAAFLTAASPSSGWFRALPRFAPEAGWGKSLKAFLALGEEGMRALKALCSFTETYLSTSDAYLVMGAGHLLKAVHLRAPIPRPRLMFGLVQNSPSFWRNRPEKAISNFFPQGHQRPIGSVIGDGEIMLHRNGFNVELGVVIGKGGKYIPVEEAISHVAGYTVVVDGQIDDYYTQFLDTWKKGQDIEADFDWFVAATCSWGGKMSDAHCAMGPWIVSPDMVGNPYDLLVYSTQNGIVRDRSHTAGTSQGIERTIHWLSTFMELQPGDVVHMGTVGTDGIPYADFFPVGPEDTIGSEIERVGKINVSVLETSEQDWRTDAQKAPNGEFAPRDQSIKESLVPAVRDYLKRGMERIHSLQDYRLEETRHFFPCYANYKAAPQVENAPATRSPRFLGCPNSALGLGGGKTQITKRTEALDVGIEVAFVVSRLASKVAKEDAADYILGYAPMLALSDTSFASAVVEPATGQERNLPTVYGRWADGYNVMGPLCEDLDSAQGAMTLHVEGIGTAQGSVGEYVSDAAHVLETISAYITLFPGDVITLGRVAERVHIPKEQVRSGLVLRGEIAGLGRVETKLERE